jgi:hypothetical protein
LYCNLAKSHRVTLAVGDAMSKLTLESLAQRVAALERALRLQPSSPGRDDWQSVVGMFAGSDFMKQVDEEGRKIREAERAQAKQELASE